MARERATRSDDAATGGTDDSGAQAAADILTRAEARALSRCAPLTPAEFKARARVAEQSGDPLRTVVAGSATTPRAG